MNDEKRDEKNYSRSAFRTRNPEKTEAGGERRFYTRELASGFRVVVKCFSRFHVCGSNTVTGQLSPDQATRWHACGSAWLSPTPSAPNVAQLD